MRGIMRRFRLSLFRRADADRDVDDELAFHLAMREARLRASGMSAADAAREAQDRFGDLAAVRRDCVDESRRVARVERAKMIGEEFLRDVGFALRALARAPGFAAAVILTLALGIGANAMLFALINSVVLHPVTGLRDSERLYEMSDVFSYPAYRDLRNAVSTAQLAGISERRVALTNGPSVAHAIGAVVTGNFFSTTGARAAVGRVIDSRDDVPGAAPVVLLAHDYWKASFGADSSMVGRNISVNGAAMTVVGVVDERFHGLHLGERPDVWVPVHAWATAAPTSRRPLDIESRNWDWLRVVGRRAPDVSVTQAHAALTAALVALDAALPPAEWERRAVPRAVQSAALLPDARDAVVRFGTIVSVVVALVLLGACANIAGLLLTRAAYRAREIAVRVALGAGRGRLIRQLLTESLVLTGAGGVAGLALFAGARTAIRGVTFPGGLRGTELSLGINGSLIVFLGAIVLLTGVLVGIAPALFATKASTMAAIKRAPMTGRRRSRVLAGPFVTAQVAIACVLLVGTGLFVRALTRAFAVDIGFRADRVALLTVDPGLARYTAERAGMYYNAVTARVAALPGIRGATWGATPLSPERDQESAVIDGYAPRPGESMQIEFGGAGPRYHEILGIPILDGRTIDDRDTRTSPPVLVVNETFARRYFPQGRAVGRRVEMFGRPSTIVGVVRDSKYHSVNEVPRPYVYYAVLQAGAAPGAPTLIVSTDHDVRGSLQAIAGAVREIEPAIPVYGERAMSSRVRELLAPQLAGAWLLALFAILALVVAAVGVYGVVAYAVSRRTREIGIRIALGARRFNVITVVLRSNLAYAAAGLPIGVIGALMLGGSASRFLYGVRATDLITLVVACTAMVCVTLIAAWLPARGAARVDPLGSLRADD